MSAAAHQVNLLAKNFTSPAYTLAEIMRDFKSPDAPDYWPFTCEAFEQFCKEREINPLAAGSVHDFFVDYHHPICECCGTGNPGLEFRTEYDPFGTGDSPDERQFVGTTCCNAELVKSTAHYQDPYEVQV